MPVASQAAPEPPSAPSETRADLIKCDDGTHSTALGAATCAGHGGISAKVPQQQFYTPAGGFPGNGIPVGSTVFNPAPGGTSVHGTMRMR